MKQIFSLLLVVFACNAFAQHSLQKIWETDSVIAVPESVLMDKNVLYVSLINGTPWDADGIGGVAKLTVQGKIIDTSWVTGLNAPKGMGIVGNRLYVADISDVVVINVANGKIERKIKVGDANGLNDITVSNKGIVYVSDSRAAKIWRIENDVPSLYLEKVAGVNGLKAVGDQLYILSGRSFVVADANKQLKTIAQLPDSGDGLEPIGNGDFIATAWSGLVCYVTADGKVDVLLDTRPDKKNTADIGYDAAKRIVYVPTFNAKTIVAYQLK